LKITKLEHACVRLEKDGRVLVLDPGEFTAPEAISDADAVLVTHAHFDHFSADRIPDHAEVWTCATVAQQLPNAHVVEAGNAFKAAGFSVTVTGKWHVHAHPYAQLAENVGFLVDDDVYHPGDSFTAPGAPVGTLLLPTNAPWLRLFDAAQFLYAVRPERAFSIHDGLINEHGLKVIDRWLASEAGTLDREVRRLEVGESVSY
jgi:L-ascorbate metabolism protein UlaG (beta-lactamase superfamily)